MALLEGSLQVTGTLAAGEICGLREVSQIVGDGVKKEFRVTHGLGVKLVLPTLYDSCGRITFAAVECVSVTEVCFRFFHAPDVGETFDVVIRR